MIDARIRSRRGALLPTGAPTRGKLADKHLDLIIANQVGIADGGFESDQNAATAYWAEGQRAFPGTAKTQLAEQLLDLITERLDA